MVEDTSNRASLDSCSDPNITSEFFKATRDFAKEFSSQSHEAISGNVHVKKLATYVETKFKNFLEKKQIIVNAERGNAAKGIDLPSLNIDIKLTQYSDPQTSSPFKRPKQKIEGLGYHLLLFTYERLVKDEEFYLPFKAVRFIPKERTADYNTTKEIRAIIARQGNTDDIFAFLQDHHLLNDEAELLSYSQELFENPPAQGYLRSYEVPQWRLTYNKVVKEILEDIVVLDPD